MPRARAPQMMQLHSRRPGLGQVLPAGRAARQPPGVRPGTLTVAHNSAHTLAECEGRVTGRHLLHRNVRQGLAERAAHNERRSHVRRAMAPASQIIPSSLMGNTSLAVCNSQDGQGCSSMQPHLLECVVGAASKQLAQGVEAACHSSPPAMGGQAEASCWATEAASVHNWRQQAEHGTGWEQAP